MAPGTEQQPKARGTETAGHDAGTVVPGPRADEEVTGEVVVDGEISAVKDEGGAEGLRDLVHGDADAIARDGGHERGLQGELRLIHLGAPREVADSYRRAKRGMPRHG